MNADALVRSVHLGHPQLPRISQQAWRQIVIALHQEASDVHHVGWSAFKNVIYMGNCAASRSGFPRIRKNRLVQERLNVSGSIGAMRGKHPRRPAKFRNIGAETILESGRDTN